MSNPKIAIYIQKKYAKPAYKTESYDVRAWPGIEMVRDDLERHGYPVGYCDRGTVTDYDVILMSITAACDWYPFIAERVKWPRGNYKVLMGGAGLLNVRPFLEYFDAVVFGRAEGLTHLVIDSLVGEYELDNPSVCYAQSVHPHVRGDDLGVSPSWITTVLRQTGQIVSFILYLSC